MSTGKVCELSGEWMAGLEAGEAMGKAVAMKVSSSSDVGQQHDVAAEGLQRVQQNVQQRVGGRVPRSLEAWEARWWSVPCGSGVSPRAGTAGLGSHGRNGRREL
jgi:hypothetical protein